MHNGTCEFSIFSIFRYNLFFNVSTIYYIQSVKKLLAYQGKNIRITSTLLLAAWKSRRTWYDISAYENETAIFYQLNLLKLLS